MHSCENYATLEIAPFPQLCYPLDMTPSQCRVARALLDWSREDLARKLRGKVSSRALDDFESGTRVPRDATRQALLDLFQASGICFDRDGVNVRLKRKG